MFAVPDEVLADRYNEQPIYTDEPQDEPEERYEDGDSQCAQILRYMEFWGSITAKTAVQKYGCYRLAARIADLKKRGYNIETVMREEIKPSGRTVRYAEYFLRGASYYGRF